MFWSCENFNKPLNLDVSGVTNMTNMFNGCTNFNQDISGWNVSKVNDMGGMFSGCTNFNQSLCSWTKIANKQVLLQDQYLANQLKICT
jgi:surface protein